VVGHHQPGVGRDFSLSASNDLLTARGDNGDTVGATRLAGKISNGACRYAFSFEVEDSATYTFMAGTHRTGAAKLASDLDRKLLLVVI
jgi:hypothetical protein